MSKLLEKALEEVRKVVDKKHQASYVEIGIKLEGRILSTHKYFIRTNEWAYQQDSFKELMEAFREDTKEAEK